MAEPDFLFRAATAGDVDAIMAIETRPGYSRLVGHWQADRHREEMAVPGSHYFVLEAPGEALAGFAILQGLSSPHRRVHLQRIAVAEPGLGAGSELLRRVVDWVFGENEAHRLDLDVFDGNERARRVYEKAGFRAEGLLRDFHRLADGSFASVWMMAILRPEWAARRAPRADAQVRGADR